MYLAVRSLFHLNRSSFAHTFHDVNVLLQLGYRFRLYGFFSHAFNHCLELNAIHRIFYIFRIPEQSSFIKLNISSALLELLLILMVMFQHRFLLFFLASFSFLVARYTSHFSLFPIANASQALSRFSETLAES